MKRPQACALGIGLVLGVMCPGCSDLVFTNVVAGVQEGATTAATRIIDTFFEEHFSVEASTKGEEGGDDLFVRL